MKITKDKIVLGSSIDALSFAFKNDLPFIATRFIPPHKFQPERQELWRKLLFSLSLSNNNLLTDKIQSVTVEDDHLRIITKDKTRLFLYFNFLYVFDDHNVVGFGAPTDVTKDLYEVLDWCSITSGMKQPMDRIDDPDNDFIKYLLLYPSDRIYGNHSDRKDAVGFSYLTKAQLFDTLYSETYARLKIMSMMKAKGCRGKRNGPFYYALKMESDRRDVYNLGQNIYEDTENIKFIYDPQPVDFDTPTETYSHTILNTFCR